MLEGAPHLEVARDEDDHAPGRERWLGVALYDGVLHGLEGQGLLEVERSAFSSSSRNARRQRRTVSFSTMGPAPMSCVSSHVIIDPSRWLTANKEKKFLD